MSPDEIRRRRLAYPLAQTELAAAIGVTAQAVRSWEAGRRTPRPAQVRAMQDVFAAPRVVAGEGGCGGRGTCACRCHAVVRYPWSSEELAYVRAAHARNEDPREIAAVLREQYGHPRTADAVIRRIHALGGSFRVDWLSENDVVKKMGVSAQTVRKWRQSGLLSATRHIGQVRGVECHWWRIEVAALDAFVREQAGIAFDPSRMRDRVLRAKAEVAAAKHRRRVS